LHIRGVDDGMLFVIDGVPVADRLDRVFASGLDPETISSMSVLTGNIPAEFGGRSGAVIVVQPKSGIARSLSGTLELAAGNFAARDISGALVGGSKNAGFFLEASTGGTNRFLDPVDERNFNNRGGVAGINGRFDWHPSAHDILIVNGSVNGSDFHVSNTEAQELAGQNQRQELRDNSQSLSWQRVWSDSTVSNFAIFHRRQRARLIGSGFDTPLFAAQDRHHDRLGLLASITREFRGHTIKGGFEAHRLTPHEFFEFAITDPDRAEEAGISDAALEFDRNNPFVFSDRKTRGQMSAFIQDQFSPTANLTITAGLRYDHSWLLASDQQFSPRIGAVYYFTRTRTSIRGSFNRLFMPPQVENLLLADSEQARALSPFESETGGGAQVLPEKTSAYEAGVAQDFRGWFRLDVAAWRRNVRNFDDPNVFFSTTIVFPNSVASGYARGLDVRLDVPEHRGWSGYLSYTNQRVLQTGPINGGLFLTDEAIEIGPGTDFIPDHDERNIGALGVMYRHERSGVWAAFSGRHESGVPLEVDEDAIEDLKQRPGADLVDFDRQRVKPWTVLGFSAGGELVRHDHFRLGLQFDVQNLMDRRFAYNFGNPFSGTHFGYPRMFTARLKLSFR
jgi:outer membrane receptor protein involved in Fe transport